ncbi:MAG: TonB family protein [Acidobacteria bacterium]|nr:TonB family protein [Acidobacteriota bacterium]
MPPLALIALLGWAGCSAPAEPAVDEASEPPILVSPADARAHLTSAPEAAYPVFARAAGVTGAVLYEIDISARGHVTDTRLVHGSPMLEQTARDAIVQWRFSPFQANGRSVPARTIVTLTFTGKPVSADVAATLDRYADAMLRCVDAARRSAHEDAETRCAAAMNVATDLSSFDRTSDARPTRLYGEAVAALGRHEDAVARFETVIARLKQVPVFSLDRALALRNLGHSLAALGRRDDALRAYRQADQQLSEALAGAERNSAFQTAMTDYLRSFLPQYAGLLDEAGRSDDAARVRTRLSAIE